MKGHVVRGAVPLAGALAALALWAGAGATIVAPSAAIARPPGTTAARSSAITGGPGAIPKRPGATPASSSTIAARPAMLVVSGAGEGHGVGMSQEGARDYALHGWSCQAILAHYYTGTALGQAPPGAVVRVLIGSTVQAIPLEQYVRGVVAAEIPPQWPAAALEAQAIASRTFALEAHAGGSRFDVYADGRSQLYRGAAGETPQTNAAVAATAGQIVTYGGQPAITYYFASSGGMTENVENAFPGSVPLPWLRGVPDPYDSGPESRWQLRLSLHDAAVRLHGLLRGSLRGILVLARGHSPRIVTAMIVGSAGNTTVGGGELASRLGLPGAWAYFSVSPPVGGPATTASGPGPSAGRPTPSGPGPSSQRPTATAPALVMPAGGAPAPAVTPPLPVAGGTPAQ